MTLDYISRRIFNMFYLIQFSNNVSFMELHFAKILVFRCRLQSECKSSGKAGRRIKCLLNAKRTPKGRGNRVKQKGKQSRNPWTLRALRRMESLRRLATLHHRVLLEVFMVLRIPSMVC